MEVLLYLFSNSYDYFQLRYKQISLCATCATSGMAHGRDTCATSHVQSEHDQKSRGIQL